MNLVIISDLHISTLDDTSDFNFSDDEFIAYLTNLMKKNTFVIFNGDWVETWERCSLTEEQKFFEIERQRPKLIKFIKDNAVTFKNDDVVYNIRDLMLNMKEDSKKIMLVVGNHDTVMKQLWPTLICKSITFKNNHISAYIAHGCEADIWCSGKLEKVGRCITSCVYLGEKYLTKNFDDYCSKIQSTFSRHEDDIYEKHALSLASKKKNRYNLVVYGHTHNPYMKNLTNELIYANTGSVAHKENILHIDEICVSIIDNYLSVTQFPGYDRLSVTITK